MKLATKLLFFTLVSFISFSCSLEKDIDMHFPSIQKKLVVECYLQPGEPFRLSLSENINIYEISPEFMVNDAEVFISFLDKRIQLYHEMEVDSIHIKFSNFKSDEKVPFLYHTDFLLEIIDSQGRKVSATTQILPPVSIESIEYKFNRFSRAYLKCNFMDDPSRQNFYRVTINQSHPLKNNKHFELINDDLFNGQEMSIITKNIFYPNDTIFITLSHIGQDHYDFRSSVSEALIGNGNPFEAPSKVKSNIQGGTGIFTGLSFDRKRVIVPRYINLPFTSKINQ